MIENDAMAGGQNKYWVRFLIRIFIRQVFTSPCTVLLLCDMLKDGDSGTLTFHERNPQGSAYPGICFSDRMLSLN